MTGTIKGLAVFDPTIDQDSKLQSSGAIPSDLKYHKLSHAREIDCHHQVHSRQVEELYSILET
jgi:hypothetical protein